MKDQLDLEVYWSVIRGREPPPEPPNQEELVRQSLKEPRGIEDGKFRFVMSGIEYEGRVVDFSHLDGFGIPNEIRANVRAVRAVPRTW